MFYFCSQATSKAQIKYLLTGRTGNGKTHICNLFDTRGYCGEEGSSMYSTTTDSFVGDTFIDTVGFGHNQKYDEENGLTGTLLSIYRTVKAVDDKLIGAVIWVYNCQSVRASKEDFDDIELLFQAMGRSIPLVVL